MSSKKYEENAFNFDFANHLILTETLLLMRFVSVLCKLYIISNHVLINCVGTIKLSKSMCYVHVDFCYHINKAVLLNQLE